VTLGLSSERMPALTPERLAELLSRLNDVMTDAARLRRQITRQLNDQRRRLQPKITAPRRRRAETAVKRR